MFSLALKIPIFPIKIGLLIGSSKEPVKKKAAAVVSDDDDDDDEDFGAPKAKSTAV